MNELERTQAPVARSSSKPQKEQKRTVQGVDKRAERIAAREAAGEDAPTLFGLQR